jgi:hypothetical protein
MICMKASTVSMRVFIASFSRCLRMPWRDISHGMSAGRTTFLRRALRAGISAASSSSAWYRFWCAVPCSHAFASLHAIVILLEPFSRRGCSWSSASRTLKLSPPGAGCVGRGSTWCWNSMFMNMYIGLVLITERPRRLDVAGVEVLMHAVVVDDGDVAGLPVVADAVVDLVALAVRGCRTRPR